METLKKNSLAILAIRDILSEPFEKKLSAFDFGKPSGKFESLINKILCNKSEFSPVRVLRIKDEASAMLNLNTSSILIFDSPSIFKQIGENVKWQNNARKRHKHLVYFPGTRVMDLLIFQDGFSIDSVNFLINESEKSIKLVSNLIFNSQSCESNRFVTIKKFMRTSMKWNTSIFYPDKYDDLHGCRLNVAANLTNGQKNQSNEIIEAYKKRANFKIRSIQVEHQRYRSVSRSNNNYCIFET